MGAKRKCLQRTIVIWRYGLMSHYGNGWWAGMFMCKAHVQRRKGSAQPARLINISSLRHATRHGHARQVCQNSDNSSVGWRSYSNLTLVQTNVRMGQTLIYARMVSVVCLVPSLLLFVARRLRFDPGLRSSNSARHAVSNETILIRI